MLKYILALGISVCFTDAVCGQASTDDSSALMKQILYVSNNYRQAPLYVELTYQVTTNFVIDPADTLTIPAIFAFSNNQSYSRFGEMEQIGNDSMSLLISDTLKRIRIYETTSPIADWLKGVMGVPLHDSSMQALAAVYTVKQVDKSDTSKQLVLNNRELLPFTKVAKTSVHFLYNINNNQPIEVTMINRSLIPIPDEQYEAFNAEYSERLSILEIQDHHYFIRTEEVGFRYQLIDHDPLRTTPFNVLSRITRDEEGLWQPVASYSDYLIQAGE